MKTLSNDPTRPATLGDLQKTRSELEAGFADVVGDVLENMVTKKEAENFVTKDEFHEALSKVVTKEEFKEFREEIYEKLEKMQVSMVTKSDIADLVGEIKAAREELAATNALYQRVNDRVDDHDAQIRALHLALA